ncbi:MAG: PAS domain S-box protein [Candidatus Latescibacteria bacterium]|nr:PAS domain S-box protein [Candidatus Latescibacterota bacterium]NIM66366.1 PAS domain S-box protein [Candidatus Latescibacterota bacterium]NIO02845.1 PAS domain S-box protein [Candidatus Latescibacterota bacterium]NIO29980.1 PAS domain S-box protein [Candidatus Latescibacterota bacterium]NIO57595.1 PAS domain S-box protein [Candidatus Latescibacterota bacterium]
MASLRPVFLRGIGRKVLLWLTFFSLVPLLVSSVRSYQHYREAIKVAVLEHLTSVVNMKKNAVLKFIEYSKFTVESMAEGDQQLFDTIARAEGYPRDSDAYYEAFNNLSPHLAVKKRDNKNLLELFVINPDGKEVCSSDPGHMDHTFLEGTFLEKAKAGTTVLPVREEKDLERVALIVATPLIGDEGRVLGILGLKINVKELQSIVGDRTGMRETGQSYLVNSSGQVIAGALGVGEGSAGQFRRSDNVAQCLSGLNVSGIYQNHEGVDVVGACRWIPDLGWGLLAEIEAEEAFAPAALMRDRTILLAMVIYAAALLAAFIITHGIVGPLNVLLRAARRMGKGAFDEGIDILLKDEFGELAVEFNAMAKNLKRSREECEKWNLTLAEEVEKRTQELNSSEERYLNLIESSVDAIIVSDLHGVVTLFNRGAEEILGYEAEEVLGKRFHDYYAGGVEEAAKFTKLLYEKERVQNYEVLLKTKNRGVITLSVSSSLLKDRQGNYSGILGVGKDMTARRELQKQLMQAERLATIGRMSSQVAHEIRNPLSSISLHVELLEEEILERMQIRGQEVAEILNAIHREIKRLYEITEDYLQFARLPKPELEVGDVNGVFAALLDFYSEELASRNLTVRKDFASGKLAALVDESQLRRAILNLLKNAADASNPGGEIQVKTENNDGHVEIVVCDSGGGISEADMDKIFEPFYSTKEMGTGLGLPLTEQIVREHHGTIHCESKLGEGSRFVISLPQYIERQ